MIPQLQILLYGVLFLVLVLGPGWPIAARLPLRPIEKLLASVVLSLIILWLAGWLVFTAGLPWATLWVLPVVGVAGLAWRAPELAELGRDSNSLAAIAGQLLVTVWCVGWLFLVQTYSGGGWAADWFEHWERARFFLLRLPLDTPLVGHYSLTARPPLVNLITAICLSLTRVEFWSYQLFTTLFSSLAFLPAALLALRWRGNRRAIAILTTLVLVSPLFVQNATFSWSKLPAALFVLAAVYFFIIGRETMHARTAGVLFSVSLAAAIIAHYSAAPYALLLAIAWFACPRSEIAAKFLGTTAIAAAAGLLLLMTWFGWAVANFGVAGTILTNTSITTVESSLGGQLLRIALNLRDTLVPHFLRSPDPALLAQTSPWGYARDWFFQCYQLNFFFAFGSLGWAVIVRQFAGNWGRSAPSSRWFWAWLAGGAVILGVAAHGARDEWGLTHICLQPLVLVGLASMAAHWDDLSAGWRRVALAGATVDLVAGILLHFAVQNFAFDRWLTPLRSAADVIGSYNEVARGNTHALISHGAGTVNEVMGPSTVLVLALLAAILILAVRRTRLS